MDVSSINSQWQSFIHQCAQQAKQGIITELDCGVIMCWTQSIWSFTNAFFMSSVVVDELDLLHRLEKIHEYVKRAQLNYPWTVFLDVERLPNDVRERSKEICSKAGFAHSMDFTCMQAMELLPPVHPLPHVEIKFATSEQQIYDALLLNVEAYNGKPTVAASAVEHHVFITDFNKQFCCIVYVDNKPVSTAITFVLDKCLYVALVATAAQHRKVCFSHLIILLCTH